MLRSMERYCRLFSNLSLTGLVKACRKNFTTVGKTFTFHNLIRKMFVWSWCWPKGSQPSRWRITASTFCTGLHLLKHKSRHLITCGFKYSKTKMDVANTWQQFDNLLIIIHQHRKCVLNSVKKVTKLQPLLWVLVHV